MPTADAEAAFGYSVSVSSDRAVIGAALDKAGGVDYAGAAYVFVRNGTTWTQEAKLTRSNPGIGDKFGFSVSIDGDAAVVGAAYQEVDGKDSAGSAHIFLRDPVTSNWAKLPPPLHHPSPQDDDRFGYSVSLSGDTVIVGAQGDDFTSQPDRGSAFAFTFDASGPTPLGSRIQAPDGDDRDYLGDSVSLSGDTAVIGSGPINRAYVLTRDLDFNNTPAAAISGGIVAIDGDRIVTSSWGGLGLMQSFIKCFDQEWIDIKQRLRDFSRSISISGNTAIAGVTGVDPLESGIAYIFTSDPFLEPFITDQLEPLKSAMVDHAVQQFLMPGSILDQKAAALSDWESLIEAYATLSLPFAMEYSAVLRAALRADPFTGELALSGDTLLPIFLDMQSGARPSGRIADIMLERSAIAQQEINDALAADPQGHPYLEFMLAELRHLRDHALDLATPDTYITPPDTTLNVSAPEGLMANDTLQLYRIVTVDTSYAGVLPQHGDLFLNPDGSFAYDPDPGFVGADSFTYRTTCNVLAAPDYSKAVGDTFSNPATVVIQIAATAVPPPCLGDIDGDNDTDVFDFGIFTTAFGSTLGDANYNPNADLDNDNDVDVFDFGILAPDFGCGT